MWFQSKESEDIGRPQEKGARVKINRVSKMQSRFKESISSQEPPEKHLWRKISLQRLWWDVQKD